MRSRWYITIAAIRAYMRIAGYPDETDGEWFDRAERELFALSQIARLVGAPRDSRWETWRVKADIRGRRTRLDLIVSTDLRNEGDLPQLVMVRHSGRGRQGAGARARRDERDSTWRGSPAGAAPSARERDLILRLVMLANMLLEHQGITPEHLRVLTDARAYLEEIRAKKDH